MNWSDTYEIEEKKNVVSKQSLMLWVGLHDILWIECDARLLPEEFIWQAYTHNSYTSHIRLVRTYTTLDNWVHAKRTTCKKRAIYCIWIGKPYTYSPLLQPRAFHSKLLKHWMEKSFNGIIKRRQPHKSGSVRARDCGFEYVCDCVFVRSYWCAVSE